MLTTSVLRRPLRRGLLRGLLLVQLLVLAAQPATLSACAASGPAGPAMCRLAKMGIHKGMGHAPCCCHGLAGKKGMSAGHGAMCAKRPRRPPQEREDRSGLLDHLDWRGVLQTRCSVPPRFPRLGRVADGEPAISAPILDIPTPPPRLVSSV